MQLTRLAGNLTLDQSMEDFDEFHLKLQLSEIYQLPVEAISLSARPGSIVVTFNLMSTNSTITSWVRTIGDAQLSEKLGVNVTRSPVSEVQEERTIAKAKQSSCQPGFWCSAGKAIPCVKDSFNELHNADDQSYCMPCPENSVTARGGSACFDDCICA